MSHEPEFDYLFEVKFDEKGAPLPLLPFVGRIKGKIVPNYIFAYDIKQAEAMLRADYDNFPNAEITIFQVLKPYVH